MYGYLLVPFPSPGWCHWVHGSVFLFIRGKSNTNRFITMSIQCPNSLSKTAADFSAQKTCAFFPRILDSREGPSSGTQKTVARQFQSIVHSKSVKRLLEMQNSKIQAPRRVNIADILILIIHTKNEECFLQSLRMHLKWRNTLCRPRKTARNH